MTDRFSVAGAGDIAIVPSRGTGLKQGVFYPELTIGPSELARARQLDLQRFLVEVIRQRDCPLHVANLWNALYFNYDLEHWGFHLDRLEQKRIPTRNAQQRDAALPVGGFVRVHTPAACGDLFAEVIYKEGAHPEVDEGWLEPALSGAPASITEQAEGNAIAVVRERFVLDLDAFGSTANDISPAQYKRLCDRARWLDRHGHLVMDATYPSDLAGLEDLDYYAEYLLREHREGLLAFCFSNPLDDDELREALLRSFESVRTLASQALELRSWRSKYFFLSDAYRERLANDGPLGESDLQSLYRGVAHVPTDERCCYSPVGPRIIEILERDGLDSIEQSLLQGKAHGRSVCFANSFIAERLADDQSGGVLSDGVHVRLDDDWQGGGVWRAERVSDSEHFSLKTLPATLPLGLGFAQNGDVPQAREGSLDAEPIASSQWGFRSPLTLRDRDLGRLRVPSPALNMLAPGQVDVAIRYGDNRGERHPVERDGNGLYGVDYPWELYPGIRLHCQIECGGSVVRVRTERAVPPLVAADGTELEFDTDLSIYEREMGLTEMTQDEKRSAPSLRDLLNRAFRLSGRPRDDGAVAMTLADIATVLLGPTWKAVETRPLAVALAEMGLERDGAEYLWRPPIGRRIRSTDRSLLAAYGEGRLGRVVRRRWAPMHLRRFNEHSGRQPGLEKRRTYDEARLRYGMHHVLPATLPSECTWVEPHGWGEDVEAAAPELLATPHLIAPSTPGRST